jgi:hypothetical protein
MQSSKVSQARLKPVEESAFVEQAHAIAPILRSPGLVSFFSGEERRDF